MAIKDEVLDELLKEYKNPEDLIVKYGLLRELTKRLLEKAMESELTHHLGYAKHSPVGKKLGHGSKSVRNSLQLQDAQLGLRKVHLHRLSDTLVFLKTPTVI